jgi:hypothetical protein
MKGDEKEEALTHGQMEVRAEMTIDELSRE